MGTFNALRAAFKYSHSIESKIKKDRNSGAAHAFCTKHDLLNESHVLNNIATFHVSGLIGPVYDFRQ